MLTQFNKLLLPTVRKNTTLKLQKSFYYLQDCWAYLFVCNYQERDSEQHISKPIAELAKPDESLRVAPTQELRACLPCSALPSASPSAGLSPRRCSDSARSARLLRHPAGSAALQPHKRPARVCLQQPQLLRASFGRELNGRVQ